MYSKKRVRRTLLAVARRLRASKTEFSQEDALRLSDWIENIVEIYCPDIKDDFYSLSINGQLVQCRFIKLPHNVTWLKGADNIFYVNADLVFDLIRRDEGK